MLYIQLAFVTDTVRLFVDSLLEFVGDAWEWFLGAIDELTCPLLMEAVSAIPEEEVRSAVTTIQPILEGVNFFAPLSESVRLFGLYLAFLVVMIPVRIILKVIPGVW